MHNYYFVFRMHQHQRRRKENKIEKYFLKFYMRSIDDTVTSSTVGE